MRRLPSHPGSWAICAGWLVFTTTTAAVHPYFSVTGVLVVTGLTLALGVALIRGRSLSTGRRPLLVVLTVAALLQAVPQVHWTHMEPEQAAVTAILLVAGVLALVAVLIVGQVALDRIAVAAGAVLLVGASAYVFHVVPQPPNDVWFIYGQAAESVFERNIYGMHWSGVQFLGDMALSRGFVYPPMTAVLMAPVVAITADVRWGFLLCMLAAGAALAWYARSLGNRSWPVLPLLLWFGPGTLLMTEWAWNEPLLLALFVGSLIAFERRRALIGVILLALAIGTKQHVWALLPILAMWRPVGPRRAIQGAALSIALCAPWLIASPRLFVHDILGEHVGHKFRFDSLSLYNLSNWLGWRPPFWLAALLMVAVVAWVAVAVHRRPAMRLPELALWLALALAAANLLNKQTFINQYWLVAGLVLLGLAGLPEERTPDASSYRTARRLLPAGRSV